MITYTIGGMGGPICRGIPSLAAAIAILTDMVRYADEDDDDDDDAEGNARTAPAVVFDYIEDSDKKYWQVMDRYGRTDMAISEESRCAHCHQIWRKP